MLIRLLYMLFTGVSGEREASRQSKAAADARRRRAIDRVNKGKQQKQTLKK